jgi:hypothetical protein
MGQQKQRPSEIDTCELGLERRTKSECLFHLRVHEFEDGSRVISLNLEKHILEGLPLQFDILDMLLLQPEPDPEWENLNIKV